MPELPEVHTTTKMLNRLLPGLKISNVWTSYGGVIHQGKNHIKDKEYFAYFKKETVGQKVESVSRRGKNVLINLANPKSPKATERDGKTILIHMKLTGHLLFGRYQRTNNQQVTTNNQNIWGEEKWAPKEPKTSPLWNSFNRFIRLVFTFSNSKNLVLSDMRKFAKVSLLENKEDSELSALGPEPLEKASDLAVLKKRLDRRPSGRIKQVLMDQEIIAGIGNIYSDEILWLAGVHPESMVSKIPEEKIKEIYRAIKIVLEKGIKFQGDSISDYRRPDGEKGAYQYHQKAYQQTGKKCSMRDCPGTIEKLKIGGRSAHFCPRHQRKY